MTISHIFGVFRIQSDYSKMKYKKPSLYGPMKNPGKAYSNIYHRKI